MKIKIKIAGGLPIKLFNNQEIIEGSMFNIQSALDALVKKYGQELSDVLFERGNLKKGLTLLINGRNVLTLPKKYRTLLKDKDEILITPLINGG